MQDEFQSLTRDSNHSNHDLTQRKGSQMCFNPSRGIAIIQTRPERRAPRQQPGFNPSRGIAIIQTPPLPAQPIWANPRFNPSRGIAIIQTCHAGPRQARPACFNPSRGIAIIQTGVWLRVVDD